MYNAIIEISKGSNMKYEYDKDAECLRLDRILHNSNVFPYNYGYIPGTLSDDGDPLDIIILCDYPIQPGAMVSCKILGGMMKAVVTTRFWRFYRTNATPNRCISQLTHIH